MHNVISPTCDYIVLRDIKNDDQPTSWIEPKITCDNPAFQNLFEAIP